ncbi:hypothetical protein E2C01_023464 [Portunus trituberculatus]|uniref:Uncharacterized protein n=1 Tax=Portunus trituberculatus TaxID=210409 RepID=A0A5B7EA39_PORTR|nr:hypothetical protein [Portunus trituberculatus]
MRSATDEAETRGDSAASSSCEPFSLTRFPDFGLGSLLDATESMDSILDSVPAQPYYNVMRLDKLIRKTLFINNYDFVTENCNTKVIIINNSNLQKFAARLKIKAPLY